MKRIQQNLLFVLACLPLAGCASSDTPPVSDAVKKQFAGGPMPPDARKKFEESMKKNQQAIQERAQNGGKQ
jgi:hypothetical protein